MIRRVVSIVGLVILACAIISCSAAPAAPAAVPPSNVPTAPAAGQTHLSLPPQPTAPPQPTGVPVPYQTAAPARIVAGPTLVPTSAPTTGASGPAPTKAPPTAAPTAAQSSATAAPTAAGVASGKRVDAKFTFTSALATIEDADPLDAAMKKVPGILECSSGQTSATVTYDPGLITVDGIMQAFASAGHPVKPQ